MATYTPEPRAYELMVLYSPELGEEALEAEMTRVSEELTGSGAEILRTKSTTPWGRRRLAYPIQNFQDAFYVLYSLTSQPGDLDNFERDLKLNTNVIRYLLIRQEKATPLEDEPEEEEETSESSENAESESAAPAEEASAKTAVTDGAEATSATEEATADEPAEAPAGEESETPADGSDEEQA